MYRTLSCLILACLIFADLDANAQFYQVTHATGTQAYGSVNVTLSETGCADTIFFCNAGPYWVGAWCEGSYTFTFDQPVSAVRFEITAMNEGEYTSFELNGSPYPITTSNLSTYLGNCNQNQVIIDSGGLVGAPGMDGISGQGGQIDIQSCNAINSVSIISNGEMAGCTFNMYFTLASSVLVNSNSPLCQGQTLNLTATNVNGGIYNWTGPNGFTSSVQNPTINNVTNMHSGQYIVTVNSDCGLVSDTVDVVVNPLPVAGNMGSNSPLCEGQTLNLTTTTVTGATYSWSGPNSFTSTLQNPSISNATVASSGEYYLTISVNGCTSAPDTINVTVVPIPAPPGVTDINLCQYTTAGPLTAVGTNLQWYNTATGGVPLPGPPIPSTTTIGTTTYYVSQTGPGPTFCESSRVPIAVNISGKPGLPDIQYKPTYCANEPFEPFVVLNGQNVLFYDTSIGGTGSNTPPIIDPTVPGTYNYYATQTIGGCESNRLPIAITVHPFLQANYTYSIKYGCVQDSVTFASTSVGASRHFWTFDDGVTDTTASPIHYYTDQSTYNVRLSVNSFYCTDDTTISVDINHPLSVGFITDMDTICQNQSITFTDTSITTTKNGIAPVYIWNFGDGISDTAQNSAHLFTTAGVYTVALTVTDFVPCTQIAYRDIYVDSNSTLAILASDSSVCQGQAINFFANYSDIGLRGVKWEMGDDYFINGPDTVRHSYEHEGSFVVKLAADYRVCRDTTAEKTVVIAPHPILNLGPDTAMCVNSEPIVLADLLNKENEAAYWLWTTGETGNQKLVTHPGTYAVTVTINGCTATDSVVIAKDCYLDVPNSFTPNSDGLNDYFFPRQLLSPGLTQFAMTIYNRWGQEIFRTSNATGRGWDGNFNGQPQPQGVFIYVIEAVFASGTRERYKGNVTLLR